jgi:hypothetical protein
MDATSDNTSSDEEDSRTARSKRDNHFCTDQTPRRSHTSICIQLSRTEQGVVGKCQWKASITELPNLINHNSSHRACIFNASIMCSVRYTLTRFSSRPKRFVKHTLHCQNALAGTWRHTPYASAGCMPELCPTKISKLQAWGSRRYPSK